MTRCTSPWLIHHRFPSRHRPHTCLPGLPQDHAGSRRQPVAPRGPRFLTTAEDLPVTPRGARQIARDIARTDAYVTSSYARKKVEMLFAHLKRILRLDRLRLRGPNGARDEFHLAATVQNLRKLAKLVPAAPVPG
jgi:hypothetical protein